MFRNGNSITLELVESGDIVAVIDKMYPLDQAAEAHKYVDTGQKNGNVVLRWFDEIKLPTLLVFLLLTNAISIVA
jgi:hypothetical protein